MSSRPPVGGRVTKAWLTKADAKTADAENDPPIGNLFQAQSMAKLYWW
jgi:hypothetical protein